MGVLGTGITGLQTGPRRGSTTVGVLLIVGGVLAILLPFVVGVAITGLIGWLLLLAGIAHFYFAWHARTTGGAVWTSLIGLLYAAVGLFLIFHPERGLLTLTILLASWFVIEGIIELVLYFRMRSRHGVTWFLINAIVTLFLGLLIWFQWPFSSVGAVGTLIGISLIFSGIARLQFRHGPPLLGSFGPGAGTVGPA